MNRIITIFQVLLLSIGYSQVRINDWKALTSPLNVRDLTNLDEIKNQTPWQEISRSLVGQLETGACLETKSIYFDITNTKGIPRNSH